ncbi:Hpt domain-containing protein [Undibacterium sp. Rencai35W]|uniref:Hpt domain-containing protein n=1 Tax=Undibacterium sp. Rencai35W TaxID=3413046 RepID=UPI003BF29CBE
MPRSKQQNGESSDEYASAAHQCDPVIDIVRLEAMCVAHESFRTAVDGMMQRLIDRGLAPIEEARYAWSSGYRDDVKATFHTLRGTLGTLGATDFQNAAYQIEMAIQDGQDQQMPVLLDTAAQCLQVVINAARQWPQRLSVDVGNQGSFGHALATELPDRSGIQDLQELKLLLAQKNMRACDVYLQLRPALSASYSETVMRDADQGMQNLDFVRVAALLA